MGKDEKIELLAPVGSLEALKAAVQNGADAVYLGGRLFSARHYAQNFTDSELAEAVKYAHLYGVKVHVAINTLIDNQELPQLVDYLYEVQKAQVDAIIVQDLGAIKIIRSLLPELELHASTQMTIMNSGGIRLVEELGLKRVVLAREVSLDNITRLVRQTKMELETFVHGALCVCYSGQCLMSSMIGGRSGNRGRCAQPCRMNYSLVKNNKEEIQMGHLLSPRDLKMIENLPLLIKAGISSLKVEGRMKRPEYVATVIRNYRQALEHYYELKKEGREEEFAVTDSSQKELAQIFNRDFTTGYFLEKPGPEFMSYQRPNNRGLMIGRVTAFNPKTRKVTISLQEPLRLNDGYEIWITKGGRAAGEIRELIQNGQRVEEALEGKVTFKLEEGFPRAGDRVFKTSDAALLALAQQSYQTPGGIKKYPLQLKVKVRLNEVVTITATDEVGRTVEVKGSFVAEVALKHPLTRDTVAKQLDRLGNTIFYLDQLETDIAGEVMVPVSELNALRREMVDKLLELRLRPYEKRVLTREEYQQKAELFLKERLQKGQLQKERSQNEAKEKPAPRRDIRLAVEVGDLASLHAALNAGADIIYFGGENYRGRQGITSQQWPEVLQSCGEKGVEAVWIMPRLFHEEQASEMESLLEQGLETGITAVLAGNLGALQLCREKGVPRIYGDYSLNIFNDFALEQLQDLGVRRVALSPELTFAQLKALNLSGGLETECLIHGQLLLMITEQCTVGNVLGKGNQKKGCPMPCKERGFGLRDRLNMVFPLECDENCRMHIFNSKTLSLLDRLPDLMDSKISIFRIDGRREEAYWVRKVVTMYRQEIARYQEEGQRYQVSPRVKEELAKLSPTGYTTGHYYRGVLAND